LLGERLVTDRALLMDSNRRAVITILALVATKVILTESVPWALAL